MTPQEKTAREQVNINFLATSKVYRKEGIAFIIKNNDIVFTQTAALANFAKIPANLRLKIDHATLRVVGRYYGNKAVEKFDLSGDKLYHPAVREFKVPLLARPEGMIKEEHGIQAYCFNQVADFLRALQLPANAQGGIQGPLFPSLKTMRIDLVNFCEYLFLGQIAISNVIRWHMAWMLDEVLVTGGSEGDADLEVEGEIYVLRNLVKPGGLFSQSGRKLLCQNLSHPSLSSKQQNLLYARVFRFMNTCANIRLLSHSSLHFHREWPWTTVWLQN